MIEQLEISHHIQKHIINVLMYQEFARFRDLRPKNTDTNLFSYHLSVLIKNGYVQKLDAGYGLSQNGLKYVDRVSSEKMTPRTQPKIITMLLIQNSDGDILLQRRNKQPFINVWTLPYGKIHIDDKSVQEAASREVKEKLELEEVHPSHIGDVYIRVYTEDTLLSTTLAHVSRFNSDDIKESNVNRWVQPHKISTYTLAPAVEEIVARSFFNDPFYFEEYNVIWSA